MVQALLEQLQEQQGLDSLSQHANTLPAFGNAERLLPVSHSSSSGSLQVPPEQVVTRTPRLLDYVRVRVSQPGCTGEIRTVEGVIFNTARRCEGEWVKVRDCDIL